MEVVIFIAMLIVPVISIAALFLAWVVSRKLEALKKLVIELTHAMGASQAQNLVDFKVSEI